MNDTAATLLLMLALVVIPLGPTTADQSQQDRGLCLHGTLDICIPPGEETLPLSCYRFVPGADNLADPAGLATGWEDRTLDVALSVDHEYVQAYPTQWQEEATRIMAGVSETFRRELDMDVRIVDLHDHPPLTFIADNVPDRLEESVQHHKETHRDQERDVSYLITGIHGGGYAGMAKCIGGAGDEATEHAIGMGTQMDDATLVPENPLGIDPRLPLQDPYIRLAAHEIGHLLSGHHHYGNCPEGAAGTRLDHPTQSCTIMTQYVGFNSDRISTLNRLMMRGWADHQNL